MEDMAISANQDKSYDSDWEALDEREAAYRDTLGDGLELVLGEGADTLAGISDGLNAHNVHGPGGQRWTAALLEAELARLGG